MKGWLAFARKVPRKAYWAAFLLIAAIALFTWRFGALGKSASLKLNVQHSFTSAQIAVFIDDQAAYTGKLNGTAKRKFGFRNGAQGSFSHTLHLRPGRHMVRVQIRSNDGYSDSSESPMDFASGKERMLAVNADRRLASMKMNWQAPETNGTDAVPTWYQGYFASLSLTVSGSVVSALFGYLVQQLLSVMRKGKADQAV